MRDVRAGLGLLGVQMDYMVSVNEVQLSVAELLLVLNLRLIGRLAALRAWCVSVKVLSP